MSENSLPAPAQPAAANPVAPEAPAAENKTFSADYVRELREEAKSWRQKAEGHRLAASEARTAADRRIVQAELRMQAQAAGMIDLDGLKLLDLSAIALDEAGEVAIPADFFDAARQAKPWLFAGTSTASIATAPARTVPGSKPAARMTPEELRAFERQHGIRR